MQHKFYSRIKNFKSDDRGDVLSAIITFPTLLIMVYMVLQIWFWSSARTTAQSAADEGLRAAQSAASNPIDDASVALAGTNAGLVELATPGAFINFDRRGYVRCATGSINSIVSRGVSRCADEPPLIGVNVNGNQVYVAANASVYTLFVPFTGANVSTTACGPRNLSSWAPSRLTTTLEDTSTVADDWGSTWQCNR